MSDQHSKPMDPRPELGGWVPGAGYTCQCWYCDCLFTGAKKASICADCAYRHRDEMKAEGGLYEKFRVERTDGASAPGGKHENCEYFVLDLTHDPYAAPALVAYATAAQAKYPLLATDLMSAAADVRRRTGQQIMVGVRAWYDDADGTRPSLRGQVGTVVLIDEQSAQAVLRTGIAELTQSTLYVVPVAGLRVVDSTTVQL